LAGRPQLVAGIQSLLGDEATVAGDAGGDIAQAIEAGVTVPEHRWQVFLAALEGARSIIVADGLLFRAMRSRAPHLPLSTLGEILSSTAGVREELGNSDLYLIESRAYHADFIRLRRYYLELGRERGCNLNLDLQGAAIPTGAVGLWPMEADRQVEWILHGHQVERVVTESLADAEAISRHSDVPVTYIGSL
ncbi:MAG: hypothetical protein GY731_14085, partial [Gammaproteobacteria bacterium]|nr:hypothetical protein [Gammaproteobacteria bacterium]